MRFERIWTGQCDGCEEKELLTRATIKRQYCPWYSVPVHWGRERNYRPHPKGNTPRPGLDGGGTRGTPLPPPPPGLVGVLPPPTH